MSKEQKLHQKTKGSVKDLTGVIWNCSTLLDQNLIERNKLSNVEKYYDLEFKGIVRKYANINNVNNFLNAV